MVTCYHVFCRTMVEPLPSCLDVFPRSFSRESPNRLARSKCWGAKRDVQLEFVITKVDDMGMVSKLRWRIWGWKAIRGVVGMKGLPVVSLNFFFWGGGGQIWWNIAFCTDWDAWKNLVIHLELTFYRNPEKIFDLRWTRDVHVIPTEDALAHRLLN